MKYFDNQEKELIEAFEKSSWLSLKGKKSKYKKIAQDNLKKAARINIRITIKDLNDIKLLAAMEGIPYQTFISSIIHKYNNGCYHEKRSARA